MKFLPLLTLAAAFSGSALAQDYPQNAAPIGSDVPAFTVRPGFKVSLVAQDFGEARFIEVDDKGTLYVSQPGSGSIAALRLKDGKYQKIADFTTGKPRVHGLDLKNGWLWFAHGFFSLLTHSLLK